MYLNPLIILRMYPCPGTSIPRKENHAETPKVRFKFLLEMKALGIQASPRAIDIEGSPSVSLIINGISQTKRIDETPAEMVQGEEPPNPRALMSRRSIGQRVCQGARGMYGRHFGIGTRNRRNHTHRWPRYRVPFSPSQTPSRNLGRPSSATPCIRKR